MPLRAICLCPAGLDWLPGKRYLYPWDGLSFPEEVDWVYLGPGERQWQWGWGWGGDGQGRGRGWTGEREVARNL